MATVEENSQWLEVPSLPTAVDPGDGQLVGVGGDGGCRTVDLDVPAQVEGGGEDHHAGVVHPLPVLPLPAGQV